MSQADFILPRIKCVFFDCEPDWNAVEPFLLKETVTGAHPKQPTEFRIACTPRDLCVRFRATDSRPWATLTGHDDPLYEEEVVEVFLDPAGDLQSYFEIEVNPLNAVCDLVLRRTRSGYRKSFAWHCDGLQTSVAIDQQGWSTELRIPFASLGPGLPAAGKSWRGNFYRIDRPEHSPWELSAWSPTGRPNFHVQERFGWIDFV